VAIRLLLSSVGVSLVAACTAARSAPPTAATTSGVAQPTAALTSVGTASTKPTATTASTARSGGTLRYAITADVAALDPFLVGINGMETSWLVFDRLTAYDQNLQPQPMLAETWDFSSDYTHFKLNLRKGVQYHNGREMTSEDVRYSLLRPRDPTVGNGILAGISNWFTRIDTPGKYTVEITTDVSRPGFFDGLEIFNICDRSNVEGPDAGTSIIGTGPFVLAERVAGDHFTFTRNSNYWQTGRPYVDSVITSIRDQQSMALQLEGGALDAVKIPNIEDYTRLKSNPNYVAQIAPNSGTFFEIGMNTKSPPLGDERVRQALNYALDRQRFAQAIFHGAAAPINLPWSLSSPAFDAAKNNMYPYDLDKARSLLQAADVANFQTDILVIGFLQPQLLAFTQIYQASLSSMGVALNVKNMQSGDWLDVVSNKKPAYTGLWAASDTLANMLPGSLFSFSPAWRVRNNHSNFTDDAYTSLVATVASATDPSKQKAAYVAINDYMLDQSFTIPVSTNPITLLSTNKVHGIDFLMHAGGLSFTNAWLDP
jgi:peptide/nickel transport system substrate-binding protein